MDSEFILDQFQTIVKKVEELANVCKSHEIKYLELTKNIKSLEEELQGKIEAEKKIAQQKALMRSKIDNLLVKLEEITEM